MIKRKQSMPPWEIANLQRQARNGGRTKQWNYKRPESNEKDGISKPLISAVTLNINGLKSPMKRILKNKNQLYVAYKRLFLFKDIHKVQRKRQRSYK